jgi:predicted PurR-regulated permease PerM
MRPFPRALELSSLDQGDKKLTSLQNDAEPARKKESGAAGRVGVLLNDFIHGRRAETGLLILGVLYTIYLARSLLLPVFLALLIAAYLQPLVHRLARLRIPEYAGSAIVVLLFAAVIVGAVHQLSAPVAKWMEDPPAFFRKVENKLWKLKASIKQAKEKTEQIEEITQLGETKAVDKVVVKGPTLAERIFTQTWSILGTAVVVLALIFFLLAQGRQTLIRVANHWRGKDGGERLIGLLLKIQRDIASYLNTIILINLGLGTATAVAMALLGMPNPIFWGAVAAALTFIPYLGPSVMLLILAAVALMTFDSWPRIILPPLVFLCLTGLEGLFLTPLILGRRLTLNPIMVFVAILFGGWAWGIPGVFLAVPTLTTVKIISDNVAWLEPMRVLISDEVPAPGNKPGKDPR